MAALPFPRPDDLVLSGTTRSWALISKDGHYRYLLGRTWNEQKPVCGWVMLNPSTADGREDDPTMRKVIGFTERMGCGGCLVGNLFAWRATDPDDLFTADDPVGPRNDEHLAQVLALTPVGEAVQRPTVVAGWGKIRPRWRPRADKVALLAFQASRPLHCLGVNSDATPRHPLMLAYVTPLLLLGEARANLRAGRAYGLPATAT